MDREKLLNAFGEIDDDDLLGDGYHWKCLMNAICMGISTMILCLGVADGMIGMDARVTAHYWQDVAPGWLLFMVFMIGVSFVFRARTRWRYTIVNIVLYYFMYFPINWIIDTVGIHRGHIRSMFMYDGGFIAIPAWAMAGVTAVIFWVIQSVVFVSISFLRYLWRKWKRLDKMPPVC